MAYSDAYEMTPGLHIDGKYYPTVLHYIRSHQFRECEKFECDNFFDWYPSCLLYKGVRIPYLKALYMELAITTPTQYGLTPILSPADQYDHIRFKGLTAKFYQHPEMRPKNDTHIDDRVLREVLALINY